MKGTQFDHFSYVSALFSFELFVGFVFLTKLWAFCTLSLPSLGTLRVSHQFGVPREAFGTCCPSTAVTGARLSRELLPLTWGPLASCCRIPVQ